MMERELAENLGNSAEGLISTILLNLSLQSKVLFLISLVLNAVEKCVGDVESLAHDKNIAELDKNQLTEKFLEAFDINNDGDIRYSEYHISNQFLSKSPKNLRQIFRYFDKNHDWVISTKELKSSKPRNIHIFLVSGKRK
jgi:Ca2+-binding EF-hand superfamily protein